MIYIPFDFYLMMHYSNICLWLEWKLIQIDSNWFFNILIITFEKTIFLSASLDFKVSLPNASLNHLSLIGKSAKDFISSQKFKYFMCCVALILT